jgi:hypothetical protein
VALKKTGINNMIISDRLYNVEQIALASMGKESIVDDYQKDTDLARRLSLGVECCMHIYAYIKCTYAHEYITLSVPMYIT